MATAMCLQLPCMRIPSFHKKSVLKSGRPILTHLKSHLHVSASLKATVQTVRRHGQRTHHGFVVEEG